MVAHRPEGHCTFRDPSSRRRRKQFADVAKPLYSPGERFMNDTKFVYYLFVEQVNSVVDVGASSYSQLQHIRGKTTDDPEPDMNKASGSYC